MRYDVIILNFYVTELISVVCKLDFCTFRYLFVRFCPSALHCDDVTWCVALRISISVCAFLSFPIALWWRNMMRGTRNTTFDCINIIIYFPRIIRFPRNISIWLKFSKYKLHEHLLGGLLHSLGGLDSHIEAYCSKNQYYSTCRACWRPVIQSQFICLFASAFNQSS